MQSRVPCLWWVRCQWTSSPGDVLNVHDIKKEIAVYRDLKARDQNGARSSVCVEMLHCCTDTYLVLEKFGFPLNHFFGISYDVRKVIAKRLLMAVSCLHSFDYVHCDLKPQNILVTNCVDPYAKLVDLDSCTKVGELLPHHGTKLKCTPAWQNSEAYSGKAGVLRAHKKTDVFCLGLLFKILLSEHPSNAEAVVLPEPEKLGDVFGEQDHLNALLSTGSKFKDEILCSMCNLSPDGRRDLNQVNCLFASGTILQPAHDKLTREYAVLKGEVLDLLSVINGTMKLISSDVKQIDEKLDSLLTKLNHLFNSLFSQLQKVLTGVIRGLLENQSKTIVSELHSVSNSAYCELKLMVNSNAKVTTQQIAGVVDKCCEKYAEVVEKCGGHGNGDIVKEMRANNQLIVDAIKNSPCDHSADNQYVIRLLEQVYTNTEKIHDEVGLVKFKLNDILDVINSRLDEVWDDLSATLADKMRPGMLEQNRLLLEAIAKAYENTSGVLALSMKENTVNTSLIKQSLLDLRAEVSSQLSSQLETIAGNKEEMSLVWINKMDEVMDAIDNNAGDLTLVTTMCQQVIDNTEHLSSDMMVMTEQLGNIQANIEKVGCEIRLVLSSNESLSAGIDALSASVVQMSTEQCKKFDALRDEVAEINGELGTAVSSRVQRILKSELQSTTGLLKELLMNTHDFPTLVLVFPKPKSDPLAGGSGTATACAAGVKGKLKNMYKQTTTKIKEFVKDVYIVQFVCAHTMQPVPCGPSGLGYEITQDKQWVKQVAPVVNVALSVLKAAFLASGVPLNISIVNGPMVSGKDMVEAAIEQFAILTDNAASGSSISPCGMEAPTRQAYESIKTVLETVDPGLKHIGLVKQICVESGRVAWIKNDELVIESFHDCKGAPAGVTAV